MGCVVHSQGEKIFASPFNNPLPHIRMYIPLYKNSLSMLLLVCDTLQITRRTTIAQSKVKSQENSVENSSVGTSRETDFYFNRRVNKENT